MLTHGPWQMALASGILISDFSAYNIISAPYLRLTSLTLYLD
jgi:hypothetical protein